MLKQDLEGYFRDPGFEQNTERDAGKRKISWRETGFDCYREAGFTKIWARGARFFFARLSEIREVVRSSGKCEVEQASVLLAMKKSEVGNDYIIETIKWSTDERIEDLQFQADARKAHMVFNDLVLMSSIAQALYIYCITWRDTLIH